MTFSALLPAIALAAPASLEEVVVTAQRRMETVQEVPIAMSAFTENYLANTGVSSTMDLALVTPGLNYTTQLAGAVPFIRGIGNPSTSAGQDASVSTYVDDVYYAAPAGSIMSFNNIERVEVLKGPQGTLFGRNATGGLMHVITRTPDHEARGQVKLSYGNHNATTASLYGSAGVTETVAADIAVYYSDHDGWGDNLATGSEVNFTTEKMARTKWLIEPTETVQVTLAGDYAEVETSKGLAGRMAPGALGADGLLVFTLLTTPVDQGGSGLPPAQAAPLAAAAAQRHSGGFHDVNASVDPLSNQRSWGVSAKLEWQLGELDLASITAYREFTNVYRFAQDQTAFPNLLDPVMPEFSDTFTQEIRLSGSTDDLDWIVGTYILSGEAGYDVMTLSGILLAPLTGVAIDSQQDTFSWAVFGQGSYQIAADTSLTAGVRYTRDERDLTGTSAGYSGGMQALAVSYDESESFEEVTWRLGVEHHLADSTLLYLSVNRGFKSGVFNLLVTDLIGGPEPAVEPETLKAYEIGIKSDLLASRLRVNAAIFHYDFQNLQAQVVRTGGAQIVNAAEATMTGGEIDITGILGAGFTLNLGLACLDAEYDSFPEGQRFTPTGFGGNAIGSADLAGNEIPRAPEFTGSLGLMHEIGTRVGRFTSSVTYYYNGGFYWESENRLEQASYSLVNAQVGWSDPTATFEVQLFGNNLGDEEYVSFGLSGTLGDHYAAAPPRTYGVRVGYNF